MKSSDFDDSVDTPESILNKYVLDETKIINKKIPKMTNDEAELMKVILVRIGWIPENDLMKELKVKRSGLRRTQNSLIKRKIIFWTELNGERFYKGNHADFELVMPNEVPMYR